MSTGASPPQSSLPEPSYTGPFTAYVSVDIDAPPEKVWAVLADFTKYPEWNPFVRSQVIVDKSKKPLEDQTPAKGQYLLMQTHIPPTMDDSVSTTEAFEQITHFDDVTHRMAWKNLLPSWFLKAERWNLAFLLSDGPHDQAQNWAALDATTRQGIKQKYNAAGVSVVVSAFGATETPTSDGKDPTALANQMAQFVLNTDLDGIDVDWEEIELVVNKDKAGVGEQWLATFTQTLRTQLPQGQFILTHAPVGPWFSPGFCPGGCYLTVDQTVGSLIDWYNIQFYNQSPDPGYETCDKLLNTGGSAVFEIQKSGVDVNKLVIGKPGGLDDVSEAQRTEPGQGGLMDPATLGTCVQQAVSNGWNAGVMSFQFPNANTAWISTVKGTSFA